MIYEWIHRDVQLQEIAQTTALFFQNRDFVTATEEHDNVWIVSAAKKVEDERYVVLVKIHGSPDDFFIEFNSGPDERAYGMFGNLATFLGLGLYMNRKLKKAEFLTKIEGQFWDYADGSFPPKERAKMT